jgi:hypothetical protein
MTISANKTNNTNKDRCKEVPNKKHKNNTLLFMLNI